MFEAIITKKLSSLLSNLISPSQHGFLAKHSISTNLLTYQSDLIKSSENGHQVDTIYTDFQKAFDKINHSLLLYKLKFFGISGSFWKWIASYLHDRTQVVKISFQISKEFQVLSGVPQGSHLGPLLFLLFINDLPQIFSKDVKVLLFADDAKFYTQINSINDSINLQNNMLKYSIWTKNNFLPLNIEKCKVVSFTRCKHPIVYNYSLDNIVLNRAYSIKDLGVLFSSDLSFKLNHEHMLSRSYKMLGFINRNTQKFKNPTTIKTIYCSLVRSVLEYASLIWSQSLSSHIHDLDNIQFKFLKRIARMKNIPISKNSFTPVQKLVNIDSLQLRRQLFDIMFVYDLLNYNVVSPELLAQVNFRIPSFHSRNHDLFAIPFFKSNSSNDSFFVRALKLANLVSISLDFFNTPRDTFRFKSIIFLQETLHS